MKTRLNAQTALHHKQIFETSIKHISLSAVTKALEIGANVLAFMASNNIHQGSLSFSPFQNPSHLRLLNKNVCN